MSFASEVKQELCRNHTARKCCSLAEAYGILLFCNTFDWKHLKIVTESRPFAERLPKLFMKAFGLSFDHFSQPENADRMTFEIDDPTKLSHILDSLGLADTGALHLNFGITENECCRSAFFRGAFLAGGSVTDPTKRYHLELATPHLKAGSEASALLTDMGFLPKEIKRGGSCILYFKQTEYIEDFLTAIGASVSSMHVMEARVEKDLRNEVNRRCNCETANLTKVVDAAQTQLSAIRTLEKQGRLQDLPEPLLETALLRRRNPEATLTELSRMLKKPVTKSALNHRMQKIIAISQSED